MRLAVGEKDDLPELSARLSQDLALKVGLTVICVALGGFITWASLVPLTEGVVAAGSAVVDTAHKTVQHLEGGIIEKLYVREGSEVKAGDLLIEQAKPSREPSWSYWRAATTAGWPRSTGLTRNACCAMKLNFPMSYWHGARSPA